MTSHPVGKSSAGLCNEAGRKGRAIPLVLAMERSHP